MQQNSIPVERVVGLDAHPDSFTAALVQGPSPRAAIVEKTFDKVPMAQLIRWAKKHTTPSDLIVLEASGNSFHVARSLQGEGRRVEVLESAHLGKLKEAHANNDKISAVRIAKAYLIGQASDDFAATLDGKVPYERCGTLDVAVGRAAADAFNCEGPEPVVLLSPACASYDQFRSFEHRGDTFRDLVRALPAGLEL